MVSTGGAERDRRNKSPYWGLVEALAAALFVGVVALGFSSITRGHEEQAKAQQATEQCAADPNKKSCADVIAVRAVVASEQAVSVGIWQTAFSLLGLAGLFGTVVFAGMAWSAARDSANADNKALEHARQVAEADQRPWIVQELVVRSVTVNQAKVKVDGAVISKNIGKTVARVAVSSHVQLFGLSTARRTIDQWYEGVGEWVPSSYILPGRHLETPLMSFFLRGEGDVANLDDPANSFLQLGVATKYTGASSGDYLTAETFVITKRDGPAGEAKEAFYLGDADDFAPERLHIDPRPEKSLVR